MPVATIFDASRTSSLIPPTFGRGILRGLPAYRVADHTASDEAWLSRENARVADHRAEMERAACWA